MEQIELSGSEIYRMEIRNLNSELARVKTHSAAQADTVAELNGLLIAAFAKCMIFVDEINRQQTFIAEQTRSIFALDERNLEYQHEEKRLRALHAPTLI